MFPVNELLRWGVPLLIAVALGMSAPQLRADGVTPSGALSISICGSSTYTCPGDASSSGGFGRNILSETEMSGVIGEGVKSLRVYDPASGSSMDVPLSPNSPLRTPDGWSPPPSGSTAPIPPNSTAATPYYVLASGNPTHFPDPSSACGAWMAGSPGWSLIQVTPSCVAAWDTNPTVHSTMGYSTGYACASGYGNLSGSVCTLQSAPDVNKPVDHVVDATRVGNAFQADAHDPDNTGAAAAALVATTSNTNMSAYGLGQNVSVDLHADGRATITVNGPGPTPGTTKTTTVEVGPPDSNGNTSIAGMATSVTSGAGTLNDPNATSRAPDPCGLPGTAPCKIDETGTPSAATGVAGITTAKGALDAVTPSSLGLEGYSLGSGFSSWAGVPVIGGSDGCVNPASWSSYHVAGSVITLDACSVWAPLKSWLAWFLYAGTAFYMYLRVARLLGGA